MAKPLDVVCLLGPTASGKTAAALALAEQAMTAPTGQPVEIISIDSALVYRQMDIGTAKPSAAELAVAPHHLIDIRDPTQAYSAAEFCDDALALCHEIVSRGARPLIVGGTMLYYRALINGLAALPGANAEIRTALDTEALTTGWPALHARLAQIDPATAARLAPNDAQRIQRALEIWMLSGEPMSVLLARQPAPVDTPYRFVAVSLEPSDRSVLHARIEKRFDAMLANGLIEEVETLRARGDLDAGMPSMRCVGYRQVWDYLDGLDDRATMRDKGIFATRQLCKRQLTWLRGFDGRTVIDCGASNALARTVEAVQGYWR